MITLLLLLLLTSCMKTEVLNAPQSSAPAVEKRHKDFPRDTMERHDFPRDTMERQDTARVPIGWSPSVEDWTNINQDLID